MARYNDKHWVRSLFLVDDRDIEAIPLELRTWSSADLKFTDTTIGGSLCVNPLPQPCVYSDPPADTQINKVIGGDGMGPFFSETFDDNYRMVTFRMGTMAFTSLFTFLANMYSPTVSAMVNKGRIDQALFSLGKVFGFGVSIIGWPILALGFLGKAFNYALGKPSSRYAYLKPAMPLYWGAAQSILNQIAVNAGIAYREVTPGLEGHGGPWTADDEMRRHLALMMPDLFPWQSTNDEANRGFLSLSNSQIDIYAVANKAQRMAAARRALIEEMKLSSGSSFDISRALDAIYRERLNGSMTRAMNRALYDYMENSMTRIKGNDKTDDIDSPKREDIDVKSNSSWVASYYKYLKTEVADGSAFVTFRVDDTGPVTESFQNNYKPSALAEKMNSISATARETSYNTAGGNLSENLLGQALQQVYSGLKSMATGALEGIGLGGLAAMGGGGVIDMPKYWESSEATLSKPTYEFTLQARYANRIAALADLFIQLSLVLPLVLPLSTGKSSHTAPFYLMVFDKGRLQSRLAAVQSMQITRGDGTMGFTPEGHLMSIKVSLTLEYMEETIAMPITQGYSVTDTLLTVGAGALIGGAGGAAAGAGINIAKNLTNGIFDDETPFTDYMAVLAGMGVNEQYYQSANIKRKLATNKLNMTTAYSAARWAAYSADTWPGHIWTAFAHKREEF